MKAIFTKEDPTQLILRIDNEDIPIDKRWTDKVIHLLADKHGWSMEPFKLYSIPDEMKFEIEVTCVNKGDRLQCANETCWDLNECQRSPQLKVAHLVEQEEKPSINYMSVVPQSDDEKFEMYMKSSKEEIARMLVNCNNALEGFLPIVSVVKEQSEVERLKEGIKAKDATIEQLLGQIAELNLVVDDRDSKIKELESKIAETKQALYTVLDIPSESKPLDFK